MFATPKCSIDLCPKLFPLSLPVYLSVVMETGRGCNRWVLVAVYCGGFVGLGLCIASLGPALLPLASQAITDVPGMAPVFVARSAGYLLGSLSGPLFDMQWFDGNALIAASLIIAGAGAALMPVGASVGALSALTVMQGVGMGFLDTGGNVLTLQLFRMADNGHNDGTPAEAEPHTVAIPHGGDGTETASGSGAGSSGRLSADEQASGMALQSLHASFAVGAIIAPLVVGGGGDQWRGGLLGIGLYCACLGLGVMLWRLRVACSVAADSPDRLPSAVAEGVGAGGPSGPRGRRKQGKDASGEASSSADGPASRTEKDGAEAPAEASAAGADDTAVRGCASDWQRWRLVAVTAALLGLYVGCEAAYGGLLVAYTVGGPQQSEQTGADVTAVYWGAIAVGRLSGVALARCLKPRAMLLLAVGLSVAASAGLVAVDGLGWPAGVSQLPDPGFVAALWPLVALLGLGFSVIFPTAIALAESFVPLAGGHATAMVIGAAVGEAVVPPAVAAAFGGVDPASGSLRMSSAALPTAVLVCCCLIVVCLVGELRFGALAAAALATRRETRRAGKASLDTAIAAADADKTALRPLSSATPGAGWVEAVEVGASV